ncbi:MAG: electron transport complex subunit RsxC [Pseudomonadota bacterium]|nr:electron transport complex subunit RsxC [Pseudomonadota bacterium]
MRTLHRTLPGRLHLDGDSMSTPAATNDLGDLHGGLQLPANKTTSTSIGIQSIPAPNQLVMPIQQHVGEPAQPIVGVGEQVLKGQLVADTDGTLSAPIHASSSGTVVAIEPWPVSRQYGENVPCIVIECDGDDRPVKVSADLLPFNSLKPDDLLKKILQGGIVGLGGAVFPTGQKLMQAMTMPLEYLILNGVECEPYISCDDLLMREQAVKVLGGAQVLMHALKLPTCYVVIESDKPEAIAAISEAITVLNDHRFVLKQVPTIYPSGGEDQLVQLVTGLEVPSGQLPTDVGCVVHNVGTAAAVYRWICEGEPLISRVTTVTGPGVRSPKNVNVRLGTTIADAIAFAGGYNDGASQLIVGGPMCGKSVTTDQMPIVKATNCILVLTETHSQTASQACIRCGECATVCPIQLLPQQLYWHARADNESKLRWYGLTDCIECGCCDLVCPSNIPLTAEFRKAKARIQELEDEKARAERARLRFESRNERLKNVLSEREKELRVQKDTALSKGLDAIAEILKRKQANDEKDVD